jgi:hypothetical protein
VLFQSITDMAPGAAIAASLPAGAAFLVHIDAPELQPVAEVG